MTKKTIIANWKMNLGIKSSLKLIKAIKSKLNSRNKNHIIICPSFITLEQVGKLLKNSPMVLGAQNIAPAEKNTWTGEISAKMVKEAGCKYVIIGHSERRHKLKETDKQINTKIKLVLEQKMTPILCVGETRHEKNEKLTSQIISIQLKQSLNKIQITNNQQLIVAYEPVWAISDGKTPNITPTITEIEQVHKLILKTLTKKYNSAIVGKSCQVIYGGSVHSGNAKEILNSPYIDGALVGGASLKASEFVKIIQ